MFLLWLRPAGLGRQVADWRTDGEPQRVADFWICRAASWRRPTLRERGTDEDTYQANDQKSSRHISALAASGLPAAPGPRRNTS